MLIFLTMVSCHEYLIKLLGRNLFIQGQESIQGLPNAGSRKDANTFIFKIIDKGINKKLIYVKDLPNQVFDVPNGTTKLIFYPMHGFSNQQFELVPIDMVRGYRIVRDGSCLGWIADEKVFRMEACTSENLDQMYEMICVDCPGRKNTYINSPPKMINHDSNEDVPFLNESTRDLIKEIGKLSVEINNCFISNGTCKSLDNSHIKLHCYSPFTSPPEVNELWPDLKYDIRHLDDYSDEPLAIISDPDDYIHYKSFQNDEEQRHIDKRHHDNYKNHLDPNDHLHQNEEIYHENLENISLPGLNPFSTNNPLSSTNSNPSYLYSASDLSKIKDERMDDQLNSRDKNEPTIEDPIISKSTPIEPPTSKEIVDFLSPKMNVMNEINF